ncbi:MAG TPA: hypothetical protein VK762_12070 [Polyangiaceae bacterium]|nr:hypothetical protein [Polyangiaceae bacterium]
MREAIAFLLLACACGAATWSGRSSDARKRALLHDEAAPSEGDPAHPSSRGAAGFGDPNRGYASLEALGPLLAPGMRRAAERESGGERLELVRADGKDTCVRVAFESAEPVLVRLLGADGTVLYEARAAATTGTLGDAGPICIRKSDTVSAAAEGPAGRVRWIAWASP